MAAGYCVASGACEGGFVHNDCCSLDVRLFIVMVVLTTKYNLMAVRCSAYTVNDGYISPAGPTYRVNIANTRNQLFVDRTFFRNPSQVL